MGGMVYGIDSDESFNINYLFETTNDTRITHSMGIIWDKRISLIPSSSLKFDSHTTPNHIIGMSSKKLTVTIEYRFISLFVAGFLLFNASLAAQARENDTR